MTMMISTMSKKKNALELVGGVLALIGLAAVLSFAFTPKAHAISEAYRRQLQREHKTQQDELNQYQAPVGKATHFVSVNANKYGVKFKRGKDGIGYLDDVVCATDESNAQATAYSCGVYQVIVRANGRTELMKDHQYVGRMKG